MNNRRNFDLSKDNKIFHHSLKGHLKSSKASCKVFL